MNKVEIVMNEDSSIDITVREATDLELFAMLMSLIGENIKNNTNE